MFQFIHYYCPFVYLLHTQYTTQVAENVITLTAFLFNIKPSTKLWYACTAHNPLTKVQLSIQGAHTARTSISIHFRSIQIRNTIIIQQFKNYRL